MVKFSVKKRNIRKYTTQLLVNSKTAYLLGNIMVGLWIEINSWPEDPSEPHSETTLTSFYFLMTTSSTIGYGDISVDKGIGEPGDRPEGRILFASIFEVFCLVFFVYLQGTLYSFYLDFTMVKRLIQQELEEFKDWMAARNQSMGSTITYKFEKRLTSRMVFISHCDPLAALKRFDFHTATPGTLIKSLNSSVTHIMRGHYDFFSKMHLDMALDFFDILQPKQ